MENFFRRHAQRAAGVSLISTLIVVMTLGVLGFIAVDALPTGDSEEPSDTDKLIDQLNAPTPAGQAAQAAAAQENLAARPSAGNPPSLASNARTAACKGNVGTLEAAVATRYATEGGYPLSVDQLVSEGRLDAAPSVKGYEMTLEVIAGQPTGRVLVNGQAGAQGCDAPAQGTK